jgi:hypothetical protein
MKDGANAYAKSPASCDTQSGRARVDDSCAENTYFWCATKLGSPLLLTALFDIACLLENIGAGW